MRLVTAQRRRYGAGPDLMSLLGQTGSAAIGKITIRTNITPPITIDPADALSPSPSPAMQYLQPEITLEGGAIGRQVVAPYGSPGSAGALIGPGALLGLLGLGFLLGRITKR